jgi:hypothetical protein
MHTVSDFLRASSDKRRTALYFYRAHAAGRRLVDNTELIHMKVHMAERRYVNPQSASGFKDSRSFWHRDWGIVNRQFNHLHSTSKLGLKDGAELTCIEACAAADTLILINDMNLFDLAADAVDRANAGASRTANTLISDNRVFRERFTRTCRAALVEDVVFVFFAEVFHGAQNRIWRCLTEAAER